MFHSRAAAASNSSEPYSLAGVNENLMLYAASLPKIAVLFAAMVAAQEGKLVIDREDEITAGTLVTHEGEVVHQMVLSRL